MCRSDLRSDQSSSWSKPAVARLNLNWWWMTAVLTGQSSSWMVSIAVVIGRCCSYSWLRLACWMLCSRGV